MKPFKIRIMIQTGYLLIFITCSSYPIYAQKNADIDTLRTSGSKIENSQNKRSFKMTTLTFGGNGVSVTKVSNKLSVMTGGRGSAIFNERFTIGGGGWGMTKGIEVESKTEGSYNFVKMGYGGVDFGYLFLNGKMINLGSRLLIAGGAVLKETVPESKDKGFKLFPVLEPAVYYQISFSKLFRFEMGVSYRYIMGTNLSYITNRDLSGFSCYSGFLVRAGSSR
jgi:hypothetical protein